MTETTASVELRGVTRIVFAPQTVENALRQLDLEVESYHVLRDGVILQASDVIRVGDEFHLVPAIAGG